ncbi:ABC transporter G family member 41 isoform X1 [Iris pallida]|uniref:ABC transporter G family member 41 isoform X1 n=1 Tax=Iris pallida TaxID=29817 RepID=A0AAX6I8R5_IRIPA|nr:ABC transporter G family member 41 isoform X1 [Iris pallida]
MGMENCADTMVGDAMLKGISGGQKRRLTTGEMIVGPTKVLFMDEISNGLDTSTTFQIVSRLQQLAHNTEATVVISLLQPPPETYNLFDDVILMAEGNIIYHGPRSDILGFFEECGFRCPERKGVADFLQEVLSREEQEQYWSKVHESYSYVPVDRFSMIFASSCIGQRLDEELTKPYDKSQCHLNALSFNIYALPKWELFKACMGRELILMKRNSGVYIFKTSQVLFVAVVMMTLFIRTRMGVDILHANYYFGSLFYALSVFLTNGIPELVMTVTRLPVFYKQKHLYPAWAYAIPAAIVKVPISLIESFMWTSLTYYVVGYSPEPERFLRHFLVLFLVHQMSLSLFRFLASYFQTMVASTVSGTSSLVVIMFFGGFILPQPSMPHWLRWGSWISPLTYSEIGLAINEFLAPRWNKISTSNAATGQQVLASRGLNFNSYFYWISVGALFVNILLFNVAFTLALTFRKSPGEPRSVITRRARSKIHGVDRSVAAKLKSSVATTPAATPTTSTKCKEMGRMALPFVPLTVAFRNLNYYVDTPTEMRKQGYARNKLQLLHSITGTFRPGVLSALMGVSGAGKTTLLDVLAGRKSGGSIEGDIRIGGYLKVQETFSRISSYCEQDAVHSPHITVEESLIYSAWLRLPPTIDSHTRTKFVNEVLETMELDGTRDSLVGISGVNGLSIERRKRQLLL